MTMPTSAQLQKFGEMTDAEREAIFAAMTLDEKLAAREMLKQQVADLKRKVADLDQQLADQERAAWDIIIDLCRGLAFDAARLTAARPWKLTGGPRCEGGDGDHRARTIVGACGPLIGCVPRTVGG